MRRLRDPQTYLGDTHGLRGFAQKGAVGGWLGGLGREPVLALLQLGKAG